MSKSYESWGRYPKSHPGRVINLNWMDQIPDFNLLEGSILAYGLGRSYGDSCLNNNGTLLDTSGLNRFIQVDFENGIIEAYAGITLADILKILIPNGWFLSVTPGTKFVTLAGAIANDVHGKNHHVKGTFGCHVLSFELLRSDGTTHHCSSEENADLFKATIGGLGLTGLITKVKIKLQRCPSPYLDVEYIKFYNLEEFFAISSEFDKKYDYSASWVDCTATDGSLGRGIYSGGNFKEYDYESINLKDNPPGFPFDYEFINSTTVKAFNALYFNKQNQKRVKTISHFEPFFYPLDAVGNWNRAYGKNGFVQYQFVVPFNRAYDAIKQVLIKVEKSGLSSFLTVLKSFGEIESPGMLSFPKPGITLAIDFRMTGKKTLDELKKLDDIVRDNGGIQYPAKDARMSGTDFRLFYPKYEEFQKYMDPRFSSDFWQRVMK